MEESLEWGVIGVTGPPAGVEGPVAGPNTLPPACSPLPIAGDIKPCKTQFSLHSLTHNYALLYMSLKLTESNIHYYTYNKYLSQYNTVVK